MKAAEAVFVIALVIIIIGVLRELIRLAWRAWHRRRHQRWHIEEQSDGEMVAVFAERPGEKLLIGAVPFAADDFDTRLYGLRAEGRAKVYTLNEGRKGE